MISILNNCQKPPTVAIFRLPEDPNLANFHQKYENSPQRIYTPHLKWIAWSVTQITIRNHELGPFSSHQMAKIWWTWPQNQIILKTHLTSVYNTMISIPDNIQKPPTAAIFGHHRTALWPMCPKKRKSCFFLHNQCFLKFHEIWMKIWYIAWRSVTHRADGQTDKHIWIVYRAALRSQKITIFVHWLALLNTGS